MTALKFCTYQLWNMHHSPQSHKSSPLRWLHNTAINYKLKLT